MSEHQADLHNQETDFEVIQILLPYIQNRTFLDIGAEKGTFAELLTNNNFTGILFEPLPKHESILKKLAEKTNCILSQYAIDNKDGKTDFHIACDDNGDPLDYFHSLHRLSEDERVKHTKSIPVICRSLNSLYAERLIHKNIGIIKTDTEGNDLHVLQGMSEITSEVLICEFFMPGIYNGWEQGDPYKLINEAKKLGFDDYLAIKRQDAGEFLSINTQAFINNQWGNLVFFNKNIFQKIQPQLEKLIAFKEKRLVENYFKLKNEMDSLLSACKERLDLINRQDANIKSYRSQIAVLQSACDEKPDLITRLDSDIKSYQSQIDALHSTCNERLDLINRQDSYIKSHRLQFMASKILKKIFHLKNENLNNTEVIKQINNIYKKLDEIQTDIHQKHVYQKPYDKTDSKEFVNETSNPYRYVLKNIIQAQSSVEAVQCGINALSFSEKNDTNTYISQLLEKNIEIMNLKKICNERDAMLRKITHSSRYKKLIRKIIKLISPKLGKLENYPPRPISLPKSYAKKISTNKNLPTISIVTPSFNQGEFLERTIQSILRQDYPQLEYIVQDGASDDETIHILKKYKSSLKSWESIKDTGQSNALNLGFRKTTGQIMAYLNSDDVLLPGSLQYIGKFFSEHPEVDVIYGHRIIIDTHDHEIGRWVLPKHDNHVITWADYIPQETLFWRREIWEKVGAQIDENFRFAMDWDLLLRFREAGARFTRLPRFLGAFRVHNKQKTSAQISDIGLQEMRQLRQRCHNRPVSDFEINKNIRAYLIKHAIYDNLYRVGILQY